MDGLAARHVDHLAAAVAIFFLHQATPADLEAADQLAAVLVESKDEAKRGRALPLSEANLRQASHLEYPLTIAV